MHALPNDIQEFIDTELASKAYSSREELIADAVRQLRSRKEQLEQLRHDIDQARDELERGDGIPITEEGELRAFFDDIRVRGQSRHESPGRKQ